jgi:hypothetical protein
MENWLRNFRKPPARLKLVEPLYDDEPERHAVN